MKKLVVLLIRFYQKFLSLDQGVLGAILGTQGSICRFSPTCSEYAVQAINKHSALKGLILIGKRIARCHPLSRGGFDPVV